MSPKLPKGTCRLCGLSTAAPIVIEVKNGVGRCANVAACAKRQRGNDAARAGAKGVK